MKKLLFTLHLYVGLTAAFFLICISLSGAMIAFEPELNRAFHPELTNVTPVAQPLNWDEFRTRVEQQSPGWKLIRFYFPDQPNWSTYVRLRNVATHKIRHVYVDQYTGKVLGSTEDGSNWIIKVHDLHVNFLSGKIGNQIVTWSTVGLLVLSLSGIILWWPGVMNWRRSLTVNWKSSFARLNWDLHNTLGFWCFLFVLMWGISGIYFAFPDMFNAIVGFLQTPSTIGKVQFGDIALLWLSNLHFGRFGWFSEAIWTLIGLVPAVLSFTGIFMCCHRLLVRKGAPMPM